MYVLKHFDKESINIEKNIVSYTHNLTTSSLGIKSINIISGSVSASYWDSLNTSFYPSGSPVYGTEHKFSGPMNSLAESDGLQHLTKFHGYPSSSIITIPSTYYGEKIKEKSFELVDKSYTDNDGNNPIIKDDGMGNLYSSNTYHSQSAITSISSSDNYIGNIFYDFGLVVITETGSWSGSVLYPHIASASNFTLEFDSFNTRYTHEYSVTLNPNEFNHSCNYTLRMPLSGSYNTIDEFTGSLLNTPYLAQEFTGSTFSPYITEINMYNSNDLITPVIKAKLPRPIRKSKKISTTFKIRLDI